jgi:hypothetical protein
MTLVAKPVIDKQFWILQDGDQKVGNIEACADGYQVKIQNQTTQFKTIRLAAQRINIHFESINKLNTHKDKVANNLVHGYPTVGKIYNPVWDVKMKLPVYTKTAKSKSWFSAGWYRVKKGRAWAVIQDPKLIVLQRYAYTGPFYTQEEANEHSSTTVC